MIFGSHVSIRHGYLGAAKQAVANQASAFQYFPKNPRIRNLCEYPEKVGFCLDTCHAFASGLWNGGNTEELSVKGVELGYFEQLKVIHLNNSKYPTGSRKDRHANIFHSNGYIHEEQLKELASLTTLEGIPLIVETPDDEGFSHKEEIELLKQKWQI